MFNFRNNVLVKTFFGFLVDLPSPRFITYNWNFGFILGITLGIQILSGVFLTIHYIPDLRGAFRRVVSIRRDTFMGWLIRVIHANGASLFFILIYIHIGRGIYYISYRIRWVWNIGVVIFLLRIVTAFLGYVLPWGQISFWGATVITNLLSVLPYLGKFLVEWVWGGFSVGSPTLNRFYTFHFLFPFIILILVIIHLVLLHETGSFNRLGISSNVDKVSFHPYFTFKDTYTFTVGALFLGILFIEWPYVLGDPENFIQANPLVTPVHIQPEWYLLFAYSILRAIPNKLGGVVALLISILVLLGLPLYYQFKISNTFRFGSKLGFWVFVGVILLLTWLGICPVEDPFIRVGQLITTLYFLYFPISYYLGKSSFI